MVIMRHPAWRLSQNMHASPLSWFSCASPAPSFFERELFVWLCKKRLALQALALWLRDHSIIKFLVDLRAASVPSRSVRAERRFFGIVKWRAKDSVKNVDFMHKNLIKQSFS
jgi:hypothetical protein